MDPRLHEVVVVAATTTGPEAPTVIPHRAVAIRLRDLKFVPQRV